MKDDIKILQKLGMLDRTTFTMEEVLSLMSLARQDQDEFNRRVRRHVQAMEHYTGVIV